MDSKIQIITHHMDTLCYKVISTLVYPEKLYPIHSLGTFLLKNVCYQKSFAMWTLSCKKTGVVIVADGYAIKMQFYESSVGLANSLSPERQRATSLR